PDHPLRTSCIRATTDRSTARDRERRSRLDAAATDVVRTRRGGRSTRALPDAVADDRSALSREVDDRCRRPRSVGIHLESDVAGRDRPIAAAAVTGGRTLDQLSLARRDL